MLTCQCDPREAELARTFQCPGLSFRLGDLCRYSTKRMRFRLAHLFGLVLLSAGVLVAVDHGSRSTFIVTFSDAELSMDSEEQPVGYTFVFKVQSDEVLLEGSAADTFGYNELFRSTVSPSNLLQLNGHEIQLTYRKHQFLWLPATRVEDSLNLNFSHLIIWHNKQ